MGDTRGNAAETHDGTGPANDSAVEDAGNDAFSAAFEAFSSGKLPDDDAGQQPDDDDEAGLADAEDGGGSAPNAGNAGDPPADAPDSAARNEAPDVWANASPELIAAREAMKADYEKRLAGATGRASGLQRMLNELRNGNAAPKAPDGQQQEQRAEKGDAEKALDAKIERLREDYPEIAEPLIAMLEAQRDEFAALRSAVAPVVEAGNEQAVNQALQALETKHADWRSFVPGANPDFDGWLSSQPGSVQELAGSWDPNEVAVAITLFKVERAEAMRNGAGGDPKPGKTETDARRQRQLDGGKAVGSRPGAAISETPDDFNAAFEHFSKKRQKTG